MNISRIYSSRWGKSLVGVTAGATLLLPSLVQASTLTSSQISAITQLLTSFGASTTTIATMTAVLSGQSVTSSTTPSGAMITSDMIGFLKKGDHGKAVCYLHAVLATDPTVAVSITTGDENGDCPFGPLTASALKKFQSKHGLDAVGFIGPKTLAALRMELQNNQLSEDEDNGNNNNGNHGKLRRLCAMVPPGHLIAPGWLKHHQDDRPVVPLCQKLPPGIGGHGGGGTGTTTLSVSGVTVTTISSTGATINWNTNLGATTQVQYGTTMSYSSTTPLITTLSTSHSSVLTSLSPSTTYHFKVTSTAGSSTVSSSDMTFTTSAAADTTAPVISALSAGSVATTSATIIWTTDENASSKVFYSSSSLDFSSAPSATASGLMTGHSVVLTGLTASTTYNYAVVSSDASGNTATSSTLQFSTTGS